MKMASRWRTSGRLTGTDSLQTLVETNLTSLQTSHSDNGSSDVEREHMNTCFASTGPMCDLLWSDPQPQVSSDGQLERSGLSVWKNLIFHPLCVV